MRTFKKVDLAVQLITIVAGITIPLLDLKLLFYPYFIVGGWQLFSCLIHGSFRSYNAIRARKYYLWTLALIFVLGVGTVIGYSINELLMGDLIFYYLEFLLLFSPILALWYVFISYKELKLYQQKEWIQLR